MAPLRRGFWCLLLLLAACGPIAQETRRSSSNPSRGDGELEIPPGVDWAGDPLSQRSTSVAPEPMGQVADPPERWGSMPPAMVDEGLSGRKVSSTQAGKTWDDTSTQELEQAALASKAKSDPAQPARGPSGEPALSPEAMQPSSRLPIPARVAWAWRSFFDDSIDPALAAFLDLIRVSPDRADVHYGAGRCLLARGELEAARTQLAVAADLDAGDPEPRFYLGVVAYQQEDFRKAIALWSQTEPLLEARPVGPLHRDLAWLMARAWLELGDEGEGQRWFERAFAWGGEGSHGKLHAPDLALERTASGRLPGGRYLPVAGRKPLSLGAGIVFASGGVLWEMSGSSRLRQQVTAPPVGWRDSHPAPEPGGGGLAFIATDPEGKCWLFLQGPDGVRHRLVGFPVAPVRPAWSIDRHVLAFVALTGENPQAKIHLLQVSTGDVQVTHWPEGASSDPSFGPHDELVMSADRNGRLELARTELGQFYGEYLKTGTARPESLESSRASRGLSGTAQSGRAGGQAGGSASGGADDSASSGAKSATEGRSRSGHARKASGHPLWVPDPWAATELEQASSEEGDVSGKPASPGAALGGKPPEKGASDDAAPVHIVASPPMDRRPKKPPVADLSADKAVGSGRDAQEKPDGEGDIRQPSVEPDRDGGTLVYARQQRGRKRIWMRQPANGLETPVSPAGQDCSYPSFSPDGRSILFVCIDGSIYRPFLFERETGKTVALYEEELSAGAPAWLTREAVAR